MTVPFPSNTSRISLSLLAVVAVACNGPTAATRAEVKAYLQRTVDWAPVEAETARTIDRIFATHFVDETEVRRQVEADRPRVAAHLARIEQVRPASDAVRRIHEGYVEAWRRLLDGYDMVLRGLDGGQVPDIAAGRSALEAWRMAILDTARELRHLRTELDLATAPPEATKAVRADSRTAFDTESGGVLLSHMATMQYHRRWRA